MEYIVYGDDVWETDTKAANAEAVRRAVLTRDTPDAEARKAVWFCDLGALTVLPQELAAIDGLESLHVGDGKTPDGGRHNPSQNISDLSVLQKLPDLIHLNLEDSVTGDLPSLSGLTSLQSLDLSHTHVDDLTPIRTLTALQSLDLSATQVADLTPIRTLTALQSLDLRGTQVADLSVLLDLPFFANGDAKSLSFTGTPLARSDRRWQMLVGLAPAIAAKDVPLYLKGEHPDLHPPKDGALRPSGAAAMASGVPVDLVEEGGKAELADAARFQPPVPIDKPAYADGVTGVRALAEALVEDLDAAVNIPPLLHARIKRYAQALAAREVPTLSTLDATMVMIRGSCADEYTRNGLDAGSLAGLDQLIAAHDGLGATPTVAEILPALPEIPEAPDRMAQAAELVAQMQGIVADAAQHGMVGPTVVIAVDATVDITNTINSHNAPATPEAASERRGLWSWVLRMGGGLTWAMDTYAKVHGWSVTPAGAAIMQKLAELLQKFMPFFGA